MRRGLVSTIAIIKERSGANILAPIFMDKPNFKRKSEIFTSGLVYLNLWSFSGL